MKRVELHASWMDGEAFRGLWAPLDDAEEFLLISCYVSDPAWEDLERTLREHLKRPEFRCTLFFSLAGLVATASRALLDRLFLLVSEHPPIGRVRAFLIDDRKSNLFHPKAHGSRVGARSKIVVGSANLTTAAARSNYEMMAVIEDDLEAYQALRHAIMGLKDAEPVQITPATIGALRDSTAVRTVVERAVPRQRSASKPQPLKLDLPDNNYDSLLPPEPDHQQALLAVRALLSRGGFLARIDQLESLMVSVPLIAFRQARLLATPRIQELGAGVSYESRGSSITVSLVPNELRQQLTKLTRPLGKLVGRFSIECLGGRWMPIDWDEEFRRHWESIAEPGWLKEAERKVEAHVKRLARELGPKGKLRSRLAEQLEVLSPAQWVKPEVRRLLKWERDGQWPQRLTSKLQDEVVQAVLEHISGAVDRRLSPTFVIAQIKQVGRKPLLRQVALETITPVDALLLLSEWTMAGVLPRLRSATGELPNAPGRSGITQVLANLFDVRRRKPESVFEAALAWQNAAAAPDGSVDRIYLALAQAWSCFVRWYGLTPERIEWNQEIPPWSSRVAREDESGQFGHERNQSSLFIS